MKEEVLYENTKFSNGESVGNFKIISNDDGYFYQDEETGFRLTDDGIIIYLINELKKATI